MAPGILNQNKRGLSMADITSHAAFVARQYTRDGIRGDEVKPATSVMDVLWRLFPEDRQSEALIAYCEGKVRREVGAGVVELTGLLGGHKGREEMLQILDHMRVLTLEAKL